MGGPHSGVYHLPRLNDNRDGRRPIGSWLSSHHWCRNVRNDFEIAKCNMLPLVFGYGGMTCYNHLSAETTMHLSRWKSITWRQGKQDLETYSDIQRLIEYRETRKS